MPSVNFDRSLQKLILILAALCLVKCGDGENYSKPADFVFRGGAVYTLDPAQPWARAVAIDEGRIVYVGDESGLKGWIGDGTRVIDIGDGMLLPGFIDSHMHPMAAGSRYLRCPLDGLQWPGEVLARLEECVGELEPDTWLRATGLDPAALEGEGPDIALLDRLAAGHPALVVAGLAVAVWANSEALRLAGIDSESADPPFGEIVRDAETGAPTGVLRGAAVQLVWSLSSRFSQGELREGLRRASELANSLGITSSSEAATTAEHWSAYRSAEKAGEMTLRVNASLRWDPKMGFAQLPDFERMRMIADGPHFRSQSVKLFLDGGGLEQTASLLEPYGETEDYGRSHYGDRLPNLVARLDTVGFDVHMHAYGDRAVRDGLDAIQYAVESNPPRERHHQLAHIVLIDPRDLPRFAALGVTADIQPLWAWLSEERQRECEALGAERCQRMLMFRELFDSGARVVAGSDWISESMSPLYNIQIAITRRPPDGEGPAWNPNQRVTLEEMLEAYTLNGARLAGQGELTGSIEVGKAADLIVLERNLFDTDPMKLKDVKVLMTLLEGEVVFRIADPVSSVRMASRNTRTTGNG